MVVTHGTTEDGSHEKTLLLLFAAQLTWIGTAAAETETPNGFTALSQTLGKVNEELGEQASQLHQAQKQQQAYEQQAVQEGLKWIEEVNQAEQASRHRR